MISQLFKVATEFRFEIGSALLGTKNLQAGVDKLSNSIDNVTVGFTRLGIAAAINLGTGGGGLLGFMFQATKSWEHFRHAQLNLVNTMTANRDKLVGPIDTFNAKLAVSEAILMRVAKRGREFGLPQDVMTQMVELLAPQLVAEGLAGTNFEQAIELSRQFLKAAPSFGISPQESTFQLQQAVGGRALLSQTFFQRLTVETDAMREFAGQTEKFNKLNAHKRLELITSALQQFTKDTDVISQRLNLLSTQFRIFKELIIGIDGIIRPFGKTFNDFGVDLMKKINTAVDIYGRQILDNFRKFIAPIGSSIEDLIVLALQLKQVSGDIKKAGAALGIFGILRIFGGLALIGKIASFVFKKLNLDLIGMITSLGIFKGILKFFTSIFGKVVTGLKFIATGIDYLFKIFVFSIKKLFAPILLAVTLFQLFSRAAAIAKVKDLKEMPGIMASFSSMMLRAKNAIGIIIAPLAKAFDWVADILSILFRKTILLKAGLWILNQFVNFLELIARNFLSLYSIIGGVASLVAYLTMNFEKFMQIIPAMLDRLLDLDFKGAGEMLKNWGVEFGKGVQESFMWGFDKTWNDFTNKFNGEEAPVMSNVQHFHGGIKIENKFKENQEPDRIAFTLIEQLSKAGRNKTQAQGATLKPVMAGGI